jgi:hypothetical protein
VRVSVWRPIRPRRPTEVTVYEVEYRPLLGGHPTARFRGQQEAIEFAELMGVAEVNLTYCTPRQAKEWGL